MLKTLAVALALILAFAAGYASAAWAIPKETRYTDTALLCGEIERLEFENRELHLQIERQTDGQE
jgi:hypothetical protein